MTIMTAFVTPSGLFANTFTSSFTSNRTPRVKSWYSRQGKRLRYGITIASIASPDGVDSVENHPDSIVGLRNRSVVTLRGLSDLSGLILLHELTQRILTCGSPGFALIADAELLLGTLMGMWTAAIFAERLRKTHQNLIQQSHDLPSKWDETILYAPALNADEIPTAVAWLCAFDELEGLGAVDMLRPLLYSSDSMVRLRLAQALAPFPLRSNICLAILTTLATDRNPWVRNAAKESLASYEQAAIIERMYESKDKLPLLPTTMQGGLERDFSDQLGLRAVLERLLNNPKPVPIPAVIVADLPSPLWRRDSQWLEQVVAKQLGFMRNAALSQPDLGDLRRYAPQLLLDVSGVAALQPVSAPTARRPRRNGNNMEGVPSIEGDFNMQSAVVEGLHDTLFVEDAEYWGDDGNSLSIDQLKSAKVAPLVDSLRWSEIHGICALGIAPAAYGLFSVFDGGSLPLRFVGLGWLLALGGLAAYPQSAQLWSSLRNTINELPRAEPKLRK